MDEIVPPAILGEVNKKGIDLSFSREIFEANFALHEHHLERHPTETFTYASASMQTAWKWYLRAILDLAND